MKSNKIFIAVSLCLILMFAVIYKSPTRTLQAKPIKPVTVETAPVTEKILAEQFETLGSLASLDSIDISPEVAGQIVSIHFQPGVLVNKGTMLIQLDNTVMKSEVASAKASLALSETNYQRLKELAARNIASEQALDKAYADLREKQNNYKVKQAQLEKLTLRAPFSGTLGSKQVSIGQYVKVGQPLVHLVANQQLRVEYNLPERLLPRLHNGQVVYVNSDAYPKKNFKGQVNYIAPAVDKETRTIAIEALIDNSANHLSSGLFVRVKHQLGRAKLRLLVPEESLIPTINGQKIFVIKGDHATAVRVKTGAHHAAMTEIARGLEASDIVVIRGQHKLKDGSKIIAIQQPRR